MSGRKGGDSARSGGSQGDGEGAASATGSRANRGASGGKRAGSPKQQSVQPDVALAPFEGVTPDNDPRETTVGSIGIHPSSGDPVILACGLIPVADEKEE